MKHRCRNTSCDCCSSVFCPGPRNALEVSIHGSRPAARAWGPPQRRRVPLVRKGDCSTRSICFTKSRMHPFGSFSRPWCISFSTLMRLYAHMFFRRICFALPHFCLTHTLLNNVVHGREFLRVQLPACKMLTERSPINMRTILLSIATSGRRWLGIYKK